jgi:GntR family transcriptional regulator
LVVAFLMAELLQIDSFQAARVDKRSPTPVYAQIASGIRSVLHAVAPAPGTLLPPERILCDHFGVSRMTLRQACDLLVRDGLIETQRGRGTLVASPRLLKQQQEMRSFTEEIQARGGTPSSKLIYFRRTEPGPEAREFFRLPEREQVFEIQRVRCNNGLPLALETVQIPCPLCPNLEQHDLVSHSLYRILEEVYGLQLTHCRTTLPK